MTEPTRRVAQVMGMPVSLALRGPGADGPQADAAWELALEILHEADRTFSTYREDSVVSRLARGELTVDDAPPDVHEVLALGERARVESGGAFDVRRDGVLDPSGVVKGWAVQKTVAAFDSLEDTDVCLSAGGDMVARSAAGAPPWRVGIEDPADPRQLVAVVPLHNGGLATSGLARRGAHITDPRTGATPTALASVTVVAPDLVSADIDATAAFVMGEDAVVWLRSRGRNGLVVRADGSRETFGSGEL